MKLRYSADGRTCTVPSDGTCFRKGHLWEQVLEMAALCRGFVLEVGFGFGELHTLLHQRGLQVEVCELHKAVTDAHKTCACPIYLGDWRKVLLPKARWDTICLDISFTPELQSLLPLLRPGGRVVWRDIHGVHWRDNEVPTVPAARPSEEG